MRYLIIFFILVIFSPSEAYASKTIYNCKIISAEKIEKSSLYAREYTLTPLPLDSFKDIKLIIHEPIIGKKSIKVEREPNFFIGMVAWGSKDLIKPEIIGSNKVGGIYDYFSVFHLITKILRLEIIESYEDKITETNRKYQCI